MKITAQEEYGLRILIRIASCKPNEGMSIAQLSETEGLSNHYVAKLARNLRMAGFVRSRPGNKGGYVLAKPASHIIIKDVLEALGGILYDKNFCGTHTGITTFCNNSVDCSARSLWNIVQATLNNLLQRITLAGLITSETNSTEAFKKIYEEIEIR